MSETPKTYVGGLTDRIMMAIHDHIKGCGVTTGQLGDPPPETHHYNRAWETVHELLTQEAKAAAELPVGTKQCGKLIARRGSIKRCALLANHEGKCFG